MEVDMLLHLRKFIQQEKVVSLQQLQREFKIDSSALLPMLDIWEKKGDIYAESAATCRSLCKGCHTSPVVFYISC
jgi:hypothetical protein